MSRLRTLAILPVCAALVTARGAMAASAVEEIGNYMQVIVPAYAAGMTMNEHDWQGTKEFVAAFVSTQATVSALKGFIDEPRPNGRNKNSFPSGHTAAAFSGATFIHRRYGIQRAIVPYMMAGFVGYSRIAADMHYLHDVAAGAAIGGLFTWAFADRYDGLSVSADTSGAKVSFKTEF